MCQAPFSRRPLGTRGRWGELRWSAGESVAATGNQLRGLHLCASRPLLSPPSHSLSHGRAHSRTADSPPHHLTSSASAPAPSTPPPLPFFRLDTSIVTSHVALTLTPRFFATPLYPVLRSTSSSTSPAAPMMSVSAASARAAPLPAPLMAPGASPDGHTAYGGASFVPQSPSRWVHDSARHACRTCHTPFSFFVRRHQSHAQATLSSTQARTPPL